MTSEFVTTFAADAILVAVKLSAPILLVALVVGLLVSIFQAVTQIQEMTLAIIPKMMGVMVVIIIFLPWFLSTSATYMKKVLTNLSFYVGLG
jgi:flagellar biosynthetic protein FliQ